MSHGPTAQDSICEPNLTPLLDVVLQLLMFFMMCVNFVGEQITEDVKLPRSASVKPMDKTDNDVLHLNCKTFDEQVFDKYLSAVALGQAKADYANYMAENRRATPEALRRAWAKFLADALERTGSKFRPGDPCVLVVGKEPMKLSELKWWLKQEYEDKQKLSPDGKVNTAIVIRADKDTDYEKVYEILHQCKIQGYTRLKLRATQRNTQEDR
jgi:biopolymer transport protein ExbD